MSSGDSSTGVDMRFVVADPSLADIRGHHYSLSRAISAGAAEKYEVIWLVNSSFNGHVDLPIEVRPVFSDSVYSYHVKSEPRDASQPTRSWLRRFVSMMLPLQIKMLLASVISLSRSNRTDSARSPIDQVANKGLAQVLIEQIEDLSLTEADLILMHTADGAQYRALLELILNNPRFERGPVFHVRTPYDDLVMPLNKNGFSARQVAFYLSRLNVLERKVYLYSEHEPLTHHLKATWGVPMRTLEIPCVERPSQISNHSRKFTVTYLGAAREEKGFHRLPYVVDQLEIEQINVNVIIQCNPQIVGYTELMLNSVRKLKSSKWQNLRLIEEAQSMEEYYQTLNDSDAILMCYDKERYKVRGSGIVFEAISFDKIVIATPDTFPAYMAEESAVLASDAMSIVSAIKEMVKEPESFRARAAIVGARYRHRNEPAKYIERILLQQHKPLERRSPEVDLRSDPSLTLDQLLSGDCRASRGIKFRRLL